MTTPPKIGRPRDAVTMISITFRLPSVAHQAIEKIAETVAAKNPKKTIRVGDVYNVAFYRYLSTRKSEEAVAAWPDGLEISLTGVRKSPAKHDQGEGQTVCVRIPETVKKLFQVVLAGEQSRLGVAGSGLTLSGLYSAAVGDLLVSQGVKIRGWNWVES